MSGTTALYSWLSVCFSAKWNLPYHNTERVNTLPFACVCGSVFEGAHFYVKSKCKTSFKYSDVSRKFYWKHRYWMGVWLEKLSQTRDFIIWVVMVVVVMLICGVILKYMYVICNIQKEALFKLIGLMNYIVKQIITI
jgi:hypothetical protein